MMMNDSELLSTGSVAAPKISSIFQGKVREKIESFRNFATSKFRLKLKYPNFDQK